MAGPRFHHLLNASTHHRTFGFIGRHLQHLAADASREVMVLDNLPAPSGLTLQPELGNWRAEQQPIMPILHRRASLLTVRLSAEEYESLKRASAVEGASFSEFARNAISRRVSDHSSSTGSLTGDLTALEEQLEQIDGVIKDLSTRIERVLGKASPQE